jgi:hypothetical protein
MNDLQIILFCLSPILVVLSVGFLLGLLNFFACHNNPNYHGTDVD